MDIALLVFRWVHILAAVTVAGGILFWRFVVLPATQSMEEAERQRVLDAMRAPWAKLVMAATLALLVTGLYNAVQTIKAFELDPLYHMLVMVKLALAFVFFYLAARMSGRSEAAGRFRQSLPFWLNVLTAIVVTLVLVAGYMKNMDRVPKLESAIATPVATNSPAADAAQSTP